MREFSLQFLDNQPEITVHPTNLQNTVGPLVLFASVVCIAVATSILFY